MSQMMEAYIDVQNSVEEAEKVKQNFMAMYPSASATAITNTQPKVDTIVAAMQAARDNLASVDPITNKLNADSNVQAVKDRKKELDKLLAPLGRPAPLPASPPSRSAASSPPLSASLPQSKPPKWWDPRGRDILSFMPDPRTRLMIFRIIVTAAVLALLSLTGFVQLYVNNSTFGTNRVVDYLTLVVWGLSAEVVRSSLGIVGSWDLPSMTRR